MHIRHWRGNCHSPILPAMKRNNGGGKEKPIISSVWSGGLRASSTQQGRGGMGGRTTGRVITRRSNKHMLCGHERKPTKNTQNEEVLNKDEHQPKPLFYAPTCWTPKIIRFSSLPQLPLHHYSVQQLPPPPPRYQPNPETRFSSDSFPSSSPPSRN